MGLDPNRQQRERLLLRENIHYWRIMLARMLDIYTGKTTILLDKVFVSSEK